MSGSGDRDAFCVITPKYYFIFQPFIRLQLATSVKTFKGKLGFIIFAIRDEPLILLMFFPVKNTHTYVHVY
jgi:hypothetical protein